MGSSPHGILIRISESEWMDKKQIPGNNEENNKEYGKK